LSIEIRKFSEKSNNDFSIENSKMKLAT
jgi:hypothetical protein